MNYVFLPATCLCWSLLVPKDDWPEETEDSALKEGTQVILLSPTENVS
jgi:hypothetical protein